MYLVILWERSTTGWMKVSYCKCSRSGQAWSDENQIDEGWVVLTMQMPRSGVRARIDR